MSDADATRGRYGPRPRRGRPPGGRAAPARRPDPLECELTGAIARYEAARLRPPHAAAAHEDLVAWLDAYCYTREAGWYDHAGIRYIRTDDGSFRRARIPPNRSPVRPAP